MLAMRYAVSNICKMKLSYTVVASYEVHGMQWIIKESQEAVLIAGYTVSAMQWVIYAREEGILVSGYVVHGTQRAAGLLYRWQVMGNR